GNVPLTNVVVIDDNGTPGNPADDFTVGTIATLNVGASATFTQTGTDRNGDEKDNAKETGTDPNIQTNVSARDPDNKFRDDPKISIVKKTNGTDNNNPTGPHVPVGSTITWTYIVTNTGNVPLTNVVIVDDNGTPGNPADDFTVGTIATLNVGASATFTQTG